MYSKQTSEDKTENIRESNVNVGEDMNKITLEPIKTKEKIHSRGTQSPRTQKLKARNSAAFAAAFHNFETARRMAQDNLLHKPLPDAILDKSFIEAQADGDEHPGLALNVKPISTGIGYKGYKVGPTQCTKLRVYR